MKTIITTFLLLAFANIIIGQDALTATYIKSEAVSPKVTMTKAKKARIAKRQNKSVSKQLKSFMAEQIKYSEAMSENCMEGEVIVQINFSDEGTVIETKIVESPNAEMAAIVQQALEALKAVGLDNQQYYGHKKIRIPVDFSVR